MLANPYTPGAGFMPAYLAGREVLLHNAESYLVGVEKRFPQQSVVYYGLRGVGKTVLLNAIEEAAENRGILNYHLEASESKGFSSRLIAALGKILRSISTKESVGDLVKKCLDLLKAFKLTYHIEESSITVSLDQDVSLSSGIYAEDLTEIFVALGRAAAKSGDTIALFVDEIQYLSEEEVGGLISAIHRCNQLRLPVIVFCAGLPKILKTLGEARSYSERLFKFEQMGALSQEESVSAIIQPAEEMGVTYHHDAVEFIVSETEGYPYFIQEYCSSIWSSIDHPTLITRDQVEAAKPVFLKNLDTGFFAVRYNRCTKLEKDFMMAMVECDSLPCTISGVAKVMRRTVKSISPCRGQLINKGMIYATGRAEIDFTVPQFDEFLKRASRDLA